MNPKPVIWEEVKVYIGHSRSNPIKGEVRNIKISTSDNEDPYVGYENEFFYNKVINSIANNQENFGDAKRVCREIGMELYRQSSDFFY